MNPFEKPEIKFIVPLEGADFEFTTNNVAFNPDYTEASSIHSAIAELTQIRLRIIKGLSFVKESLTKKERAYNAWLAEARTALRPEGKSFKNMDEAQDALYSAHPLIIETKESEIVKLKALKEELLALLDTVEGVRSCHKTVLETMSR